MNKTIKSALAILLTLAVVLTCAVSAFAAAFTFNQNTLATVVTVSDYQDDGTNMSERFVNILTKMKNDGLTDPDSLLMGGDFSKVWPDYATIRMMELKDNYLSVFPNENKESVICVQGNHDIDNPGLVKTGFYDMGAYCLYAINENDFQWNQFLRTSSKVEKLAKDVDAKLTAMIESGDKRPVIVITHVPLHHTDRTLYGDNKYASYLFNVLNKAGEKLDIVFLFGHNHSSGYDDYIGGSVNLLKEGDTIRIPKPDAIGENCYTEEKLTFTYANCGYVGYSGNSTENGSTNILTVGAIEITEDTLRLVKYSENGFYRADTIERKAPCSTVNEVKEYPAIQNPALAQLDMLIANFLVKVFGWLLALTSY